MTGSSWAPGAVTPANCDLGGATATLVVAAFELAREWLLPRPSGAAARLQPDNLETLVLEAAHEYMDAAESLNVADDPALAAAQAWYAVVPR